MKKAAQQLNFNLDTASSLAKHNCNKCYGRGFYWFQKSSWVPGKFGELLQKYCGCVVKRLQTKNEN